MEANASILSDELHNLPEHAPATELRALIQALNSYLPPDEIQTIFRAYECAEQGHRGQQRKSGEPYIVHPIAVAHVLADLHLDAPSISAALLHDVIEDTSIDKAEIAEQFSEEVAELVDGVSTLDKVHFKSEAEADAESFRKMVLAMTQDIRVIIIKLADRLHNTQTLGSLNTTRRRRFARESLEIYAPIAHRLGINGIRVELEDIAFKYLYPLRYRVINEYLEKALGGQQALINDVDTSLKKALSDHNISAKIHAREKNRYSIYRKMRSKGRSLSDILDVVGLRIVVEDPDDCYRALGIVHQVYRPVPGKFKDYIAIPKLNGYQSLHTVLFGPRGVPIEVQLRTEAMEKVAEAGIASHWLYRSGERKEGQVQARTREWLSSLMAMDEAGRSEEFLESVKVDLFPDQTYVFTPNGDIFRLPRGATAIDFAYAVHTDIGNRCVAVKIDRRLVPLRTPLVSGQTIEIITSSNAQPNPAWANFAMTAKARANIRSYLRNQRRGKAVSLGKRLLDNALREFKQSARKVPKERMQAVIENLKLKNVDALYEEIGLGRRLAPLLARRLVTVDEDIGATTTIVTGDHAPVPLAIAGTEGMVVTYARCCHPVPGDAIMGFLSTGRGVVIHRDCCGNLSEFRKQPEKWIAVEWNNDIERDFNVEIKVDAMNHMGVLANLAAEIAEAKCNIEHVNVVERVGDISAITFLIKAKNRTHLANVMRALRRMRDVVRVARICK
ncbi:MAG: bifunctional (p)ppGpp synthetase/guanosine-3',5'-bis(diphosphate) 3'-pyrophosphohydrolase [Gammaproteobacteria bacterium]|nr:bifunctional (p)ppGpp synthetase/guanosine-3',5'-bis(diphosphate) 3'-pyrophosphohydrolase [Gammaproteobacteria bacterium]